MDLTFLQSNLDWWGNTVILILRIYIVRLNTQGWRTKGSHQHKCRMRSCGFSLLYSDFQEKKLYQSILLGHSLYSDHTYHTCILEEQCKSEGHFTLGKILEMYNMECIHAYFIRDVFDMWNKTAISFCF